MRRLGDHSIAEESGFTLIELLVVTLVLGVVVGGLTSVVISSLRVEQTQTQMQDVIDDGRLAMTRIRQEVRSARRILHGSDDDRLYFWVDQNQDALVQPPELVCYAVEPLPGSSTRFQISRWDQAATIDDCEPGLALLDPVGADPPEPPGRTVLAQTLLNDDPFAYSPPPPDDPNLPRTREVDVLLVLEAEAPRGPESMEVEGTVRLRNVP